MEYIIKLICKKNLTDKNLKVNETVWIDNVFGKETFTRIKKNACKFISTVRADKLVNKYLTLFNRHKGRMFTKFFLFKKNRESTGLPRLRLS